MKPLTPYQAPSDSRNARDIQRHLRKQLVSSPLLPAKRIAGVDVAYQIDGTGVYAALIVLNADTLECIEITTHVDEVAYPYVPGELSFREIPPLLPCFEALNEPVDLIVCDGGGTLHPRGFGLAAHLGVLFDCPSVGCAKTKLLGEHEPVELTRGSAQPIHYNEDVLGAALRTQDGIKPVFVSAGHRATLEDSLNIVLKLASQYRLPETTRHADHQTKVLRAKHVTEK